MNGRCPRRIHAIDIIDLADGSTCAAAFIGEGLLTIDRALPYLTGRESRLWLGDGFGLSECGCRGNRSQQQTTQEVGRQFSPR
jgi:hypothetical protein